MWFNEEAKLPASQDGNEHLLIFEDRAKYTNRQKKPVPSGTRTCNLLIAGQHFNHQATSTPTIVINPNVLKEF